MFTENISLTNDFHWKIWNVSAHVSYPFFIGLVVYTGHESKLLQVRRFAGFRFCGQIHFIFCCKEKPLWFPCSYI